MGCHCQTKGNRGWAVSVSVGLKETVGGLSLLQSVGLKETGGGLSLAECRTKGNSGRAVTGRVSD